MMVPILRPQIVHYVEDQASCGRPLGGEDYLRHGRLSERVKIVYGPRVASVSMAELASVLRVI